MSARERGEGEEGIGGGGGTGGSRGLMCLDLLSAGEGKEEGGGGERGNEGSRGLFMFRLGVCRGNYEEKNRMRRRKWGI